MRRIVLAIAARLRDGLAQLLVWMPFLLTLLRRLVAGNRHIIVVGGHGGEAFDDNARAIARYLRRDKGYLVVWAAGFPEVRARARAAKLRTVRKGLPVAELLLLIAHATIYSHSPRDVSPLLHRYLKWRVEVYLGHGVWGLKRVERRDTEERAKFDLGITSSEREAELKHQLIGGPFVATGLPKHDALVSRTAAKEETTARLLYAPTWRDWLQHKASDRAIALQLSGIPALAAALPPKDPLGREIKVTYLLHRNIRAIVEQVSAACKKAGFEVAISNDIDVNQLLSRTDYLVTDYSAVLWDYIVQRKPAARYVFDEDVYQKLTGGYAPIEALTKPISFDDPSALTKFLFSESAAAAAADLAEQMLPLADGRACERVELAMSRLIAERAGKAKQSDKRVQHA
jgi:hypothetical protein